MVEIETFVKEKLKIPKGSGTFTSLTPLSMQDMKLNASAALIDQSMSPYHAGELRNQAAYGLISALFWREEEEICTL